MFMAPNNSELRVLYPANAAISGPAWELMVPCQGFMASRMATKILDPLLRNPKKCMTSRIRSSSVRSLPSDSIHLTTERNSA